jgi:hypothetical protein
LQVPARQAFIDVQLKGPGLTAMGIHEVYFFSKNKATIVAFETPRQEMQKGLFTPYIQMPDARCSSWWLFVASDPQPVHTATSSL